MVEELIYLCGLIGLFLAAGLVIGLADRRHFSLPWLLVCALLVLVNDVAVTRFFGLLAATPFFDGSWNWLGKVLALLVSIAIAAQASFGFRESGLTLRQKQLGGALAAFGVLVILYSVLAWFMGGGGADADAETLAFQSTLPGIEEEIFYRGVLLLAMDKAFTARVTIAGARIGWSLPLNALLFGLVHGLSWSDGAWSFDALSFWLPLIGTIPVVWLREKTGSVLLPILLHNYVNLAFVLLPL